MELVGLYKCHGLVLGSRRHARQRGLATVGVLSEAPRLTHCHASTPLINQQIVTDRLAQVRSC